MMVTYNDGDDLAAMIVLNNANSQRAIAIVSVCPGKFQVKYQIIDEEYGSRRRLFGIGGTTDIKEYYATSIVKNSQELEFFMPANMYASYTEAFCLLHIYEIQETSNFIS